MLQPGDTVDIIAPSGRFDPANPEAIRTWLHSWQLQARIPENILGPDALCANTATLRLEHLQAALYAEDSTAIWCVRGGYGATELLTTMKNWPPPKQEKYFIGFSDITALHLFFNQFWGWQPLHGPVAQQIATGTVDQDTSLLCHQALLTPNFRLDYSLSPINQPALTASTVHGALTGGNLSLVACSLGTFWQIDSQDKILLLEDVNEPAYRIERSLIHLQQANVFEKLKVLILGDFTIDNTAQQALIETVLQEFAKAQSLPVYRLSGMGHGKQNKPWRYSMAEIIDHHLIGVL